MRSRGALFLTPFILLASLAAAADEGNRIALIEDASADFALRLKLIQEARDSIDVNIEHSSDPEIGLPLLLAMRDAANRGVRVRMMSPYFASVFDGSSGTMHKILDDATLKVKPELIL